MGALRKSFDATVKQSSVIERVDGALVEAGRTIADQIDFAVDNLTGTDVTKALYLMPHLVNILRELLATPAVRRTAGIGEKETTGGKLQSLQGGVQRIRSSRAG